MALNITRSDTLAGGAGGILWDDNIVGHYPTIVGVYKVDIRHGDQIDAIQVTYRLKNGSTYTAPRRGGSGGILSSFTLASDEAIVRIEGKTNDSLVDQITFTTKNAAGVETRYGSYGRTGQTPFYFDGRIVGFFGRAGNLLDAIGVYYMRSAIKEYPVQEIIKVLQDSLISHKDDKFLIHGPGGVGKSSLIAMFLRRQRHLIYNSTSLCNHPLHLCPVQEVPNNRDCIRNVSNKTYTATWEEVDYSRLNRMIAHTAYLMSQKVTKEKTNESRDTQATLSDKSHQGVTDSNSSTSSRSTKFSNLVGRLRSGIKKIFKDALTTKMPDDPHNIEGFLTEFQQGLRNLVQSEDVGEYFISHSIRIIDSGGQPQFHDLLFIFIPKLSGLVSVFKLCEPLAVQGQAAFYKKGKSVCKPYESYYTNENVIRHDLQVMYSETMCGGVECMPNLAFVGTHLDKYSQEECSESPDEKDKQLHNIITQILPKDMQQSVITAGGLNHVTFRINARTPTTDDYEVVNKLKSLLMNQSHVQSKNLPLSWFGYEVALYSLMQELDRQCLSKKECEFIGHGMGFDTYSLNAALEYLCELNIISFFDAVPDIIFGSSQVILDKITELVTYNMELKDTKGMTGAERKFLKEGVVSLEILNSEKLSGHYKEGLFEPHHLLMILVSKLVVTKVGHNEFMMPCVLEVSNIYPPPKLHDCNFISSFVLHFSKKSPIIGIYCCTLSYLMTEVGWQLLTEDGEVVQVARNSITFEMIDGLPGKLTFRDPLSSYLEVIVEHPSSIVTEKQVMLYHEIRKIFFKAITKAMQNLNYEVMTPQLSFLCPEQLKENPRCSKLPHLSTVNDSHEFLKCSVKPAYVYHDVTDDQKIWLQDVSQVTAPSTKKGVAAPHLSISEEQPTLPQLLRISLPARVGSKSETFGALILDDKNGSQIACIKKTLLGDQEEMTTAALIKWLEGKGVEVSWKSLIKTLRECDLRLFAEQIQMALDQLLKQHTTVHK